MTICEQLKAVMDNHPARQLATHAIKNLVAARFGANKNSIVPSDYCYRLVNQGISFNQHLFIYRSHSKYEYVVANYRYTGTDYERRRGVTNDQLVEEWENGVLQLFNVQLRWS